MFDLASLLLLVIKSVEQDKESFFLVTGSVEEKEFFFIGDRTTEIVLLDVLVVLFLDTDDETIELLLFLFLRRLDGEL